jgi:protease IV
MRLNLACIPLISMLGFLLLSGLSVTVLAQEPAHRNPYRSTLPLRSMANPTPLLDRDVSPAAIALVRGFQLGLAWHRDVQGGALATELFGPLSLGFGVDHLAPLDGVDGLRTSLDVGMRLGRTAALGFTWQRTFGDSSLAGRDPLSVGLLLRAADAVSFSLAAFNLSEQKFDSSLFSADSGLVRFGTGLAIRPGTGHLEIEGAVELDRKALRIDSTLGLTGRIVDGLEVGVHGQASRTDGNWGWGLGARLALLSPFGDLYGAWRMVDDDHDFAAAMRWSTVSDASVLTPGHYVVKMDLPVAFREGGGKTLFGSRPETLLDFRRKLAEISRDPSVDGVFLTIRPMGTGWAQAQEIAVSLRSLRKAGKKVVSYILNGNNQSYFLAAQTDSIVVNPASLISLTGIYSNLMFFVDALASIGIEAQFVRVGPYKTYPEKFIRTEPSGEYRAAHEAMLDDFYQQLVDGIAEGRKVDTQLIRDWIDSGPHTARRAEAAGMVDRIAPRTDISGLLGELGLKGVTLTTSYPVRKTRGADWGRRPRIAVVTLQGSILDGNSFTLPLIGTRFAGSETIIRSFLKIAGDPTVDGVLLRIDSPGGDALASERMNRSLTELASKKPVVVSIGNMAASGGYYVAVAGQRIFISSGSVTGSIGVWFGRVVISGLLDRLGVSRTSFTRGKNAGVMNMDYRLNEEQMGIAQARIQEIYELFRSRVAAGRKRTVEEIEELAQGRVWTGKGALENGLADSEGGCLEALEYVLKEVGIDSERKVELVYYPQRTFGQMVRSMGGAELSEEWLVELGSVIRHLTMTTSWAIDPWLAN